MPKLKNPKHEAFAAFLATGNYSIAQAYEACGYECRNQEAYAQSGSRLHRNLGIKLRIEELQRELGKKVNEVAAAITKAVENRTPVILARALSVKTERVQLAEELVHKILAAMEERGKDPAHQEIPGMSTGVVVVKYKIAKDVCKKEYEIDNAPIAQIKALNEYIARELGQISDKQDIAIKSERDIPDSVLEDMLKKAKEEKEQIQ